MNYNTETDPIGNLLVLRDGQLDTEYADAYSEALRAVALEYTGRLALRYARHYVGASVKAVGMLGKLTAQAVYEDMRPTVSES